ncbi:MAG: hypothetical protein K2M29_01860, partial [Paramuribaculum sp.]|nr:hypothetical protein [Paramuribaculum sp.]
MLILTVVPSLSAVAQTESVPASGTEMSDSIVANSDSTGVAWLTGSDRVRERISDPDTLSESFADTIPVSKPLTG